MTVAALTDGRAQILGDGATDRVDLPFQFVDQHNLEVIHTDADGNRTEWHYQQNPGGWSYSGGDFSTGTVHFTASDLQAGEHLTVLLVSDFDQPYSLAGGEIDPAVMEKAMDRTAINMQSVATRALMEENGGFNLAGRRMINAAEAAENTDIPTFQQVLEIASLPGAQGPKGPIGDQGPEGPQGAEGPQGSQGLQGERGPQGYEGPRGPTGYQGPEGPRGPEGPAGPTGGQGPIGPEGPQGPEGPVGKTFEPDAAGPTADRDAYNAEPKSFSFMDTETGTVYWKLSNAVGDWSVGVLFGRGPQGLQGPQGIQGPSGPVGMNHRGTWSSSENYVVNDTVYYDGSYYICETDNSNVIPDDAAPEWGLVAAQGERGLQGLQGIQGAEGQQGIQGPEGVQGVKGDQGIQGPQGAQGPQGEKGDPGLAYSGGWSSGTTYNADQTVTYNGSSYISLRVNVGKNPSLSPDDWGLLASKGDVGPQGSIGPEGPAGPISGDIKQDIHTSNGVFATSIPNYANRTTETNVDHIWHDDSGNAWHFCSDTTYKGKANSRLYAWQFWAYDRIYVGENGGGDSWLEFYDDNSNTWRYLGWDDSANKFIHEDNSGAWHDLRNLGQGQSWQNVTGSRTNNTVYQNTTGRTIMVSVGCRSDTIIYVSANNSSWILVSRSDTYGDIGGVGVCAVIPPGHYYKTASWNNNSHYWAELR